MPLYEYYCPPCGSQFEVLRPVKQMDSPAVCPSGHTTNNRVLSLFAPLLRTGNVATMTMDSQAGGDSCCSPGGGGCSCC
jgi:putative FmdB family regulatory protein